MNAIFFDMDGTLIDSQADLAATVNHTRQDLGLPAISQTEILSYVGQGAKHLLEQSILKREGAALPAAAANKTPDDLLAIFMSHYAEHMIEAVTLYPGVERTLAELHERGWLMGVNTAKPAFATHAILERFGLGRYFGNAVIAGGDCKEMKPSPLPLIECAARMRGHRLSADDWMVGDNWTDVQCGTNAGVKTAFCTFGFGQLKDSRCTVKLDCFGDLLRHLLPEAGI